jgi:ADP-ribosylglycohydrolase
MGRTAREGVAVDALRRSDAGRQVDKTRESMADPAGFRALVPVGPTVPQEMEPILLRVAADIVAEAAEQQARVTGHTHPTGQFGARMQALAIHESLTVGHSWPANRFIESLLAAAPDEFTAPLNWIGTHLEASPHEAATNIGTGSRASASVTTALWVYCTYGHEPEQAMTEAVRLGGDTDTIAAMVGAITGAAHGEEAFPKRWIETLEKGLKGRHYILQLADSLIEQWDRPA